MNVLLEKSPLANKKFRIIFEDGYKVDFGDKRYEDLTTHKNEARKKNYILRHAKRENWNDPKMPSFWSRWLLWEKIDINDAIKNIKKKFNINIYV